jgi:hypothetical protein
MHTCATVQFRHTHTQERVSTQATAQAASILTDDLNVEWDVQALALGPNCLIHSILGSCAFDVGGCSVIAQAHLPVDLGRASCTDAGNCHRLKLVTQRVVACMQ